MKRVYHHADNLEEAAMWRSAAAEDRPKLIKGAAELMKSSERFLSAARRALIEWPNSCEHNLSATNTNRLAWLGHAGCYLAVGSPEDLTRLAWHTLTESEQRLANKTAHIVVKKWEQKQRTKRKCLSAQLELTF